MAFLVRWTSQAAELVIVPFHVHEVGRNGRTGRHWLFVLVPIRRARGSPVLQIGACQLS